MPGSISVVTITFNEEANIRRCLEGVRWADEIIVVDCGSTDHTLEICSEYQCRVFHHEWEGYAKQKNYGIARASGDWILSLDADEEVTSALAGKIREAVKLGDADAYSMPRSNQFLGKWMRHGGWYPDHQVRLFRRGQGEFKVLPLHERVQFGRDARIGMLANPLLHYTYPSVRDFIRKADLYTAIEVETIIAENRVPKRLLLSLLSAFPIKFAEVYFYKSGWRDGLHGFVAAMLMASRAFIRYAKVWEMVRSKPSGD